MKRFLITTLFLGGLAMAFSPGRVIAAGIDPPPLVAPATAERHVGKVVWADLVTPDLVSAKNFYSGLFGWTFRDFHHGDSDYSVAYLNGRPIGGLLHKPFPRGEQKQPAWLAFLSVRDVDAAGRTASEQGGKLVFEPRTFKHRGRQAVVSDPEGAVFGIITSNAGDPADFLPEPGEWLWSSLISKDADKAAAFYQSVFGYEVFNLPTDDNREHLVLSSDDYARAGVNSFPDDSPRRHSHWINFVRVVDVAAAADKVITLGGRVLVEPHADRHGARVALIADPGGAPLGLMEWSDTGSQEDAK